MRRWALACLAQNADEYGFAQLRVSTLAWDLDRDERQTRRYLKDLTAHGWITAVKRAVEGCGNVYFLNLAKLSFEPRPNALKSPLHTEFLARAGRAWPGPRFEQAGSGNGPFPADNPQGVQRTFRGGSPDISGGSTGHFGLPNKEAPVLRFSSFPGGSTGDDDGEEENFLSAVIEAALAEPAEPAETPPAALPISFPSGTWRPPGPGHAPRAACLSRPRGRAG